MEKNALETMRLETYQQNHHERNREKTDRWYYEENKEILQKWLVIDTRHSLKKKLEKKKTKSKRVWKKYRKIMSEEDKQRKKEYMKD